MAQTMLRRKFAAPPQNVTENDNVTRVLQKLGRTITVSKVKKAANVVGAAVASVNVLQQRPATEIVNGKLSSFVKCERIDDDADDCDKSASAATAATSDDDDAYRSYADDDDDTDDDSDDEDYVAKRRPVHRNKTNGKRPPPLAKQRSATTTSTSTSKVIVVKMKNPAAYVCMTCKQKFTAFEPLKAHMATSRRCKQIPLTCEVCGKICDTKKALYQHNLTHREKHTFVCDECGKTYSNRFNLENHKSSVHGEHIDEQPGSVYKCKVCDRQFTNRRDMYAHINEHGRQPTVHLCDTCGKCFGSADTLRSHIRVHMDIRPFACEVCEKRFRSRLQLMQHSHVHTGIKLFNCAECGKSFAKRGSLVAHVRVHTGEQPYECNGCRTKFQSINKLRTHAAKCHDKRLADDGRSGERMSATVIPAERVTTVMGTDDEAAGDCKKDDGCSRL